MIGSVVSVIRRNSIVSFEMFSISDFIRPICLSPELFILKSFEGFSPTVAGWGGNSVAKNGMYCKLIHIGAIYYTIYTVYIYV